MYGFVSSKLSAASTGAFNIFEKVSNKVLSEKGKYKITNGENSDEEETCVKEIYVDETNQASHIPVFELLHDDSSVLDRPQQDKDTAALLRGNEHSDATVSSLRDQDGADSAEPSQRQIGFKGKHTKKRLKKDTKKKVYCNDVRSSGDFDDEEYEPLLNIQKSRNWKSSTSDYMSQMSDDSNPSHFQRNNGTRMSNLYKWNSVIGFPDPSEKTPKPSVQKTAETPPSVVFKHVKNAIFSTGSGEVKDSTIMSFNSSERDIISEKVKGQTMSTLHNFMKHGPFVETEGYTAAKQLISNSRNSRNDQLVFLYGSGDGCSTTTNSLLADISGFSVQENEDSDDSSESEFGECDVVPYVIYDSMDWGAIDKDKPAVIAVHDAAGVIQTDMTRLNDTISHIQNCMQSRGNVTIVVSIKKLPDFDKRSLTDIFGDRVVIDLQSTQHVIKKDTMRKLIEKCMIKHNVHYIQEESSGYNHNTNDLTRRYISRQMVDEIVRTADSRGFVKNLEKFFEEDFTEGLKFFNKPDISIIHQINELYKSDDPGFLALLAVHDYGGELSIERVEQIRRSLRTNKPMSALAIDLNTADDVRSYKYKPFIPKQSLALKYAKKNKSLEQLGDILLEGMELLVETLLEENNNIYRFRCGQVESSFLVVLAKLYPDETLTSCSFDFINEYVSPRSMGKGRDAELYVTVESSKTCDIKKAMIKRITDEMLQRNISKCAMHLVFKEQWFVDDLFCFWKKSKLLWKVLQQTESNLDPYNLLYFGQHHQFRSPSKDNANNAAEMVCLQEIWNKKRRSSSKWTEWVHSQECEAMIRAIELGRDTTVKRLAQKGTPITTEMLRHATDLGHLDIVKVFMTIGSFTENEWWGGLMYAFEILMKEGASDSAVKVFELLTEKANVNNANGEGQPLIHFAVSRNNQVMTEILCNLSKTKQKHAAARVNLNVISLDGDTALNIATRKEYEEIVQMLLDAGAKQVNQGNVVKLPIHEAAEVGNINLMRIFISNKQAVLNIKDPDGNTPLHIASEHGHSTAVSFLLEQHGIEKDIRNGNKQTALHLAVKLDRSDVVQCLVDNNVNIIVIDGRGETALSLAVRSSNYNVADIILRAQTEKRLGQDNVTLMKAVLFNDFEMLKLLIANGYSMNTADQKYGSPVFAAIETNMHNVVEFLLNQGADANQTFGGFRPVLWAALKSDKQMFSILRDYGADIRATEDDTGDSVVHNAVKADNVDLTREILSSPERLELVDMKNKNDDTAVHTACRLGQSPNILQLLLDAGFSVSCRNKQAETPIQILEMKKEEAFRGKNHTEFARCIRHLKMVRRQYINNR